MEPRMILIHGYAKKLKNNRKKYLVLTADKDHLSTRLEVFDNESKWRSGLVKRTQALADLFLVADLHRLRMKFGLGLYLETSVIYLVFCSDEERKRWREQLDNIAYRNRKRNGYVHVEHAWQANVKFKAKESSAGPFPLVGPCRVCLTKAEVLIFNTSLISPDLTIQYPFVRQCSSRCDGQFKLELGRAAPTGECDLVIQMADEVEAKFAHEQCANCMQQAQVYRSDRDRRNSARNKSRRQSGIDGSIADSTSLANGVSKRLSSQSSIRSSQSLMGMTSPRGSMMSQSSSVYHIAETNSDDDGVSTGETVKYFSVDPVATNSAENSGDYLTMELSTIRNSSTAHSPTSVQLRHSFLQSGSRRTSDDVISQPQTSSCASLRDQRPPSSASLQRLRQDTRSAGPDTPSETTITRVINYLTCSIDEQGSPNNMPEFPKRANSLGARPPLVGKGPVTSPGPRVCPGPLTVDRGKGLETSGDSTQPGESGEGDADRPNERSSSTPQLVASRQRSHPSSASYGGSGRLVGVTGQSSGSLSKASSSDRGSSSHRENEELFMEVSFERPRTSSDSSKYRQRACSFNSNNSAGGISGYTTGTNTVAQTTPGLSQFRSRAASLTPHWMTKRANTMAAQRAGSCLGQTAVENTNSGRSLAGVSDQSPSSSVACTDEYMEMVSTPSSTRSAEYIYGASHCLGLAHQISTSGPLTAQKTNPEHTVTATIHATQESDEEDHYSIRDFGQSLMMTSSFVLPSTESIDYRVNPNMYYAEMDVTPVTSGE